MRADLFLFNSSFTYEEGITLESLYTQIKQLHVTITHIRELNEDRIFKHNGIYEFEIYPNHTIFNFLYNPNISISVPRDIKRALTIILDRANTSNLNEPELVNLIKNNNRNNLNGLLILHSIHLNDIDSTLIIKTKEHWYKFHRCFLAKNPIDEENFYNESKKYFPQISFHPHVEISLRVSVHRPVGVNSSF